MKCINRIINVLLCIMLCITMLVGCSEEKTYNTEYEIEKYNANLYQGELFATNLCVTNTNIELPGYTTDDTLHAAGLFDVANNQVLYADKLFDQLYPASTTKLMTAYLVLKYGNLEDIVTVGENATQFEPEAQLCGLQVGDQLSMNDLLNGLLLYSGNDNAVAIAEHMSGSVEAFSDLMNQEAVTLGATHSHFVNPHGLHEDDHYTTAYDLYLIFNACIKDQRFLDIISQDSFTATITNPASGSRQATWTPTNYYSLGRVAQPEGVVVFGGKTGTTDEAGSCVILYNQNTAGNPYISVVMGGSDKTTLYNDTSSLLSAGITN